MDYESISIKELAETYHSKSGDGITEGYLRSHVLIDYIKNQKLWQRIYKDKAVIKEQSESMKKGTAMHRCVLERGADFVNDYYVGYPINPKTNKEYGAETIKVQEYLSNLPKDKPFISTDEMKDILKINEIVKNNKEVRLMLKDSFNERVIRTQFEGVNCQIRIDAFNPSLGIVDFKKTRCMNSFLKDADKFGYWYQAGFYSKIFEVATGENVPFNWVVAEDAEPFEVCVFSLENQHLEYAKKLVVESLLQFKESIKNNQFLTGRECLNIATWWRADKEINNGEFE